MPRTSCFYWGSLGSALPEIIRIYKIATSGQSLPDFSLPYFLISAVFVVAGGLFTVAWRPENEFKAIWVGISFPVIVSALARTTPPLPS